LKQRGMSSLQCMNISFTDVLRGDGGLHDVPPQDMIYSAGLLDYLSDRRYRMLVHKLYAALAPGGMLIVGNMNDTQLSNLWPMEFITDWTLMYRGDAEMRAWAHGLRAAECWTETERRLRAKPEVNLPFLSVYSFRHRVASALRASKSPRVPGEQISYQLGHRRPGDRTTRGYGAYEPEYLDEAARALGAWINRVLKLAKTNSHSNPTTATEQTRRRS
jgi:hypothetical protein